MSSKILVIDDEEHIVELLQFNLETSDYIVDYSYDGFDGFLKAKENKPDLILLDWMLPNISGIDVLKKLRGDKDLKNIPVIMLTAKNMESDKVEGLVGGADDYITKPFQCEEIIARVNSQLRRYRSNSLQEKEFKIYKFKELILDEEAREVRVKDKVLSLTAYEFQILSILVKNPDKVFSREILYSKVWKNGYYGEDNSVNVHISNIRKKIKEVIQEEYIKTVWGIGFKMNRN